MAFVYSQPDFDTSSLVNDDELQRNYAEKKTESEMESVVKDGNKGAYPISDPAPQERQLPGRSADPNRIRKIQRQLQSSEHFYESTETEPTDRNTGLTREQIRQSKHLPNWIWVIVTSVLGINRTYKLAFLLAYSVTLLSALTFTVAGIVVVVYDISSKQTTTTAHVGFISLLIGAAWICLGVYSFKLAGRLFGNADFAASVRVHSRTLFKISSAGLLIVLGLGFTGLNLYSSFDMYENEHCEMIRLHHMVCKTLYISRVVFCVIAMVWNLMMGCMLLSVCRTHTIGIRRFIRDLDSDAELFELYWKEKLRRSRVGEYNMETASILNNSGWMILDNIDMNHYGGTIEGASGDDVNTTEVHSIQADSVFAEYGYEVQQERPQLRIKKESLRSISELPDEPPIMSEQEVLLCYWKISSRMRFTSRCLQRWLSSWIAFVVLWCADYVIYWLSHSPNILGIMEFLAPMVLLLVLCSAYAEANGKGLKMIRCIVPTKERFKMLNFLFQQPLQMQVFNLSISYNAILTVLLAFSVAFSSRLILDEVVAK